MRRKKKRTVSSLGVCPGNFQHQEGRESWRGFTVITQSDIHWLPWQDLEHLWDRCLPLIFLFPFFQLYSWWLRSETCLSLLGPCSRSEDGQLSSREGVAAWKDRPYCTPRIGPVLCVKTHPIFLRVRELGDEHLYAQMLCRSVLKAQVRWLRRRERRSCRQISRTMPQARPGLSMTWSPECSGGNDFKK